MLDFERLEASTRKTREKLKEIDKKCEEVRRKELEQRGITLKDHNTNNNKQHFDSIYTIDNGTATILYLIVMIGGSIFYDRWLIWIVATFIYLKHITRHM